MAAPSELADWLSFPLNSPRHQYIKDWYLGVKKQTNKKNTYEYRNSKVWKKYFLDRDMALLVPEAGEAEVVRYTYKAYILFYIIPILF